LKVGDLIASLVAENESWQSDAVIVRWGGTIYGLDSSLKALSFMNKLTVDMSLKHLFDDEKYFRSYGPYLTKVFGFMVDIS